MKKRGIKKRVLAALMTACMVVGSVPGVSLADATTDNSGISYTLDGVETTDSAQTAITLNKEAKPAGDGKYDITLTVDATKAKDQIQVKPTEVAFVLDASGSMAWCTDETHNHKRSVSGKKCGKVDETNPSRWNVAIDTIESMSTELENAGVTCHYIYFQGDEGAYQVDKAADYKTQVVPAGGTPISAGVKKGIEVLNAAPEGTNKILIIIADGGSTDTYMEHEGEYKLWPWIRYDNEKQILKDFKATGKSYTVSFALNKTDKGTSMDENKFKALANAGNLNAKNAEDLKKVFETISKDITSGINDPLGENITMTSGTLNASDGSASYDENTNTIKWNSNGTMKDKLTLTYTVELTDEAKKKVGKIDLNGNAEFNYSYTKDGNKVDKQIKFPKPSITGATLTVNYVDEKGNSVQEPVTEWVGFTGQKAFETTIPQINDEIAIGTESYRVTGEESDDFAMTSLMVHPLMATEGKAYSVTVRLTKVETQPTIYKVTYDANGGAWDWSFSKDGYNLNATGGADKLTKDNARGEETLELLSGNELPTRENYDFDGWYLDGQKLTAGTTVASAAGTRTEVVVKAHWTEKKPEVPRKPVDTEIVPAVIVECLNASNSGHQAKQYDVNDQDSYEIGEVRSVNGKYVSTVKVISAYYAMQYNADVDYDHAVTVEDITYDLTWNPVTKKWEAPALTRIPTIKVDCSKDTPIPTDPELPGFRELEDLIEGVVLVHTGSNAAAHPDEKYTLMEDGYEISWYGTTKAILTVKAAPYVSKYIADHGNHDVKGAASAKLILARTDGGWGVEKGTTPIRFFVKCTENNPEKPALPKYDDLKKLFGETINVTCETDEQHTPQSFGLMAGTYSVTRDKEDDNEAVVTVFAKDYIKAYADGKHTNAGDDAATVKLFCDEDGKWYSENQEIVINFKAKCDKTPETPEKQYTEIKFVVVNGTFTENGQTELTKTFEVGTKLTLADIPASKGKSSSYSDQTWDKFPIGYVVGKDGTTFTITYKWRSSGSDSDDSDYDYGTSTRGKATNAAGKSGRWILEGGEFTEDNGRLPSNEYLKIGDTIYGFYTYGFAIDFDRPEYYTDAAIQAKGGYRDATGTWRLNGWWFCYDDGTFPHDEWVYLTWNGRSDWYYFDVDGWMEDGWLYRNNNWYYLHTQYDNTRGHMYTGWHEIDGKWYYFNTASDKGTLGVMLANTTTPDGYQVDANGAWIR